MAESVPWTFQVIDGGKAQEEPGGYRVAQISFGGGSGGGGGGVVDNETKNYIDKSMETVRAENDARFTQVLSKLDGMNPSTWWQNALLIVGAIGIVFSILAYASDRFDSGVASMGAVEEAIDSQRERDAAQNARIDRILEALEGRDDQPEESSADR